ncbi:MAG: signal peptide peptidase SppA, partial [Muribaculaceae bacterium]|nr:signal peptide peptidase SppA [Muribaculaceae bacterium]
NIRMLKRFFISFASCMAAIWLSALLAVVLFLVFIAALLAKYGETDAKLVDHTVLVVDLTGSIDERPGKPSITDLISSGEVEMTQGLNQIVAAIDQAADDPQIDGIYLKVGGSTAGIASRMAIVDALNRFNKSKKFVYAYGDFYDQGDYIIATAADKIYVNPQGVVNVAGLSATTLFFKGLLDKVGVEMQVFKVGTYKSAVEPFILNEMSEASREQQQSYLDAIWNSLTYQIGYGRGVDDAEVQMWADSICTTWDAERLIANNVVDGAIYEHEMDAIIAKQIGKDDPKDVNYLNTAQYCTIKEITTKALPENAKGEKIAVLYAVGDITDKTGDGIVGAEMVPLINDIIDDDNVKGLVLRVNSGGGSAFASEQIWEALERFKATGRPFYVSMGDVAASGGYYISCGADKIYAQPETLTGSIGIFGIVPCAKELLNDKLGINTSTVSTNGAPMNLFQPFTPAQSSAMQRRISQGYDTFLSRVAKGRNKTVEEINTIAQGRVWSGKQALDNGLVDEMGTLYNAINDMKANNQLRGCEVVEYPADNNTLLQSVLSMKKESQAQALDEHLGEAAQLYHAVDRITHLEPVQCRMETVILR